MSFQRQRRAMIAINWQDKQFTFGSLPLTGETQATRSGFKREAYPNNTRRVQKDCILHQILKGLMQNDYSGIDLGVWLCRQIQDVGHLAKLGMKKNEQETHQNTISHINSL
uniref:SFRICE_018266 n=1 Tax=Spodoptera frugiperda TaxID=7108 RepID=A0A2H1VFS8_SPOFR